MKFTKVHGHAKQFDQYASPTYSSWTSMKSRCKNTKLDTYPDYGGRGIKVCHRWESFTNFLADMGVRPKGTTLGRKDNQLGYFPGNCEWQTASQQMRNTRVSRYIEFNGRRWPLVVWAENLGLSVDTISKRLDLLKWPLERALTTPARNMKNSACAWKQHSQK